MAEEKSKKTEQKKEKVEEKKQEPKVEEKQEQKAEEKKKVEVKKVKKDYALARANDLAVSPKELFAVCNMIRGRNIDVAMKMVEEVLQYKRVVKMNNREVPHQHGNGVMAGRFPMNAAKETLRLLKHLRANAIYHEVELEKVIISCKADIASKPYKRGGARFKRAHLMIRLDKKIQNKLNKDKPRKGVVSGKP